MNDESARKKKLVLGMAEIYGVAMTANRLALYTAVLDDLSATEIERAIRSVIRDAKITRFPLPADIRSRARPEPSDENDAIEASNRIVEAIVEFGYGRQNEAKRFVGELGWLVVTREGGWISLCERVKTDELPILKAQWRELAKTLIARGRADRLDEAPALPKPERVVSDLKRIGE